MKRDFSNKNKSKLNKMLKTQSWNQIYFLNDAQKGFTFFQKQFLYIYEECFPEKEFKITYKNRRPWVTDDLRHFIAYKHKLRDVFKSNPTKENLTDFKKQHNKVESLLDSAERAYYGEQLEINKNDLRKSWKTIKTIIGKNCDPHTSNIEYTVNGHSTQDPSHIANAFNDYFIEIGPKLASEITPLANPLKYVTHLQNSIFIPDITETEVTNVVRTLNNSSPGWDELQPKLFKSHLELYLKPLTYLINVSIKQGIFPDELKIAKVVPIFKSGDKSLVCNYRPISVLSFFSKIYEKIMYNYLIDFVNSHNILYKYQFGFRKQY